MRPTRVHAPPRLTPFAISYGAIVITFIALVVVVVTMQAAVRAYIGGEGLWSKAQKQAVMCLERYAMTGAAEAIACYHEHIRVPLSIRVAREELQRERYDPAVVRRGFEGGGIDPGDVGGMTLLFRYFGGLGEMRTAIEVWRRGDAEIERLQQLANTLDSLVLAGWRAPDPHIATTLQQLRASDAHLTALEDEFSSTLGVGARRLRTTVIAASIIVGLLLGMIAVLFAARWVRTWRDAQQLANDHAARMRAVATAAAGVVGAGSLDELDAVLRNASSQVIEYDTFLFGVYHEDTHTFHFLRGVADGMEIEPNIVPAAGTPSERLLYDRTTLLTTRSSDPRSVGATIIGSDRRSESVVRCAIHAGARLLGIISVQSYTPDRYTHDDVEVLEALASMAAIALERVESMRDREVAEQSLRESEERYRQLVEMSPDAVAVQVDERIEFINSTGAHMLGAAAPADVIGRSILDFVHPLSLPGVRRRIAAMRDTGEQAPILQEMFVRLDGSIVDCEVLARPFRYRNQPASQIIIRDVTERRQAQEALRRSEEQLRQAQKMEAVGLLAGGVAHDFNNLLTAIRGHAELLSAAASLPAPLREHALEIKAAADRATALTRQLLAFSRKQVLQPRVVDLNVLVGNVESLVSRLIGAAVELITSLQPDLGHVRADPHQLEQVMLNLVLNARDAMPQGGSLVIETCDVEIDSPRAELPSVQPGSYVRLSVQDSGVGMTEESRARIFEPFYTTKEVGKGTGLGLSTAYGIIKQSDGHIYARSRPGEGTVLEVFLPRIDAPLDPPLHEVVPLAAGAKQDATILVVEDEDSVRALVVRVLRREGYAVLEAANGADAMCILDAGTAIDLLLTDMVMPGMSGVALAQEALRLRPDLTVIYMSGYTEDEVFRRGLERGDDAFLQKPFAATTLLAALSDALTHV
ncbi:MAG TPA: response regulator [Longimicrobiales bacterium]|nr:response regulator [Longimicrobiales bacterium]